MILLRGLKRSKLFHSNNKMISPLSLSFSHKCRVASASLTVSQYLDFSDALVVITMYVINTVCQYLEDL